jgi:hypothetical protein
MSKRKKIDLNYNGVAIHLNPKSESISLTDMWKAAGSNPKNKPVQWFRQARGIELLLTFFPRQSSKEIMKSKPQAGEIDYRNKNSKWMAQVKESASELGLILTRSTAKSATKSERGSYAIPDLAIAYAEYLSPEFHAWALSAIEERIQEESDPELAYQRGRERSIKGWKRQGKSDDWIQDRINGIENYKQHTGVLKAHGVGFDGKRNGYAECADAINKEILGGRSKNVKANLGLGKSDKLRDHLNRLHLTALSFSEAMADNEIEANELYGNYQCIDACSKAGCRTAIAAQGSTKIIAIS